MYTIKISSRRKKFIGPHVLEDLIEPGTSQGTRTLNPWQNPEPMMTTHLKRDNERKMGGGGLGRPTESADASKKKQHLKVLEQNGDRKGSIFRRFTAAMKR